MTPEPESKPEPEPTAGSGPNGSATAPDQPPANRRRGRLRRWCLRLLLAAVLLLTVSLAAAWLNRDRLLGFAADKAVERLASEGIHLSLGPPRWTGERGLVLSDLVLFDNAAHDSELLTLSEVAVRPNFGRLIRHRDIDLTVASRDGRLWITGMDPDEQLALDDVALDYRDGRLLLERGDLGIGGVRIVATGEIPTGTRPVDKEDLTEEERREEERRQEEKREEDRDLAVIIGKVGTILAEVLEWTRFEPVDGAEPPVLALLLNEPEGGVSGRLQGGRFDWQGMAWDGAEVAFAWADDQLTVEQVRLAAADCEVVLAGSYDLDRQRLEVSEWRITGNPLGPLVAYTGDSDTAVGWEVIRPVVIEGGDLDLPLDDPAAARGYLRVVEPGELRWRPAASEPADAVDADLALTLNQWQLDARLGDGALTLNELELGGEVTGDDGRLRPVRLSATGAWDLASNLVTVPRWTIEGDVLELVAAVVPVAADALEPWTMVEPVALGGSDWRLPLDDLEAGQGRLQVTRPGRLQWRPVADPGQPEAINELVGLVVELTDWQLDAQLEQGELRVDRLHLQTATTGDHNAAGATAEFELTAAWQLDGQTVELPEWSLTVDRLPAWLALLPAAAEFADQLALDAPLNLAGEAWTVPLDDWTATQGTLEATDLPTLTVKLPQPDAPADDGDDQDDQDDQAPAATGDLPGVQLADGKFVLQLADNQLQLERFGGQLRPVTLQPVAAEDGADAETGEAAEAEADPEAAAVAEAAAPDDEAEANDSADPEVAQATEDDPDAPRPAPLPWQITPAGDPVVVSLSGDWAFGGDEIAIEELSATGDLPALLSGLSPAMAGALDGIGWSGEDAGLRLSDGRVPLADPMATRVTIATTAPVDLSWQIDDDTALSWQAIELEASWADQRLTIDSLDARWLGGRLQADAELDLTEGETGATGTLRWTDNHGPLEVPFEWSATAGSLTLAAGTSSRADLLALWTATPWGEGTLPEGLALDPPPGLRLEQPLVIVFEQPADIELDLLLTDQGTVLVPVGDDGPLPVEARQLRARLHDGLWQIDDIDARVAEGELTGSGRSREGGLWDLDVTWSEGDVSQLLGHFGADRRETRGSRGTVTFAGLVGGELADVQGGGRVELTDAPLVNIFLLREIYQLIAILLPVFQAPGVGTVAGDYELDAGVLTLSDVVARSDTVVVRASGTVDFNQEQLEILALANLQGIAGLATAVLSRALEVEVAGDFDDFQVSLRNAQAFTGVPGFVLDSSRVVVQSGYQAPIKILEIGADGGMRVLGEGVRIIEGGARLLEEGVRDPAGIIRRLPFLGRDRDDD